MEIRKPCSFLGSSKKDLLDFPEDVRSHMGHAFHVAQMGGKVGCAKPLKGFGSGVLEVVDDFDGDTYRAVYGCGLPMRSTSSTPSRKSR